MRRLCNDIRTHWISALLFLAYWLAAWILDAAIAIARRGEVGAGRAPVVFALACLVSPVLAAALAACWHAPEGARYSFGAAALAGAVICEANLVVIFCEDAGVSTLITGGVKGSVRCPHGGPDCRRHRRCPRPVRCARGLALSHIGSFAHYTR